MAVGWKFKVAHMISQQGRPPQRFVKATLVAVSALTVIASITLSPALPGLRVRFSSEPNADVLIRLIISIFALFIVIGSPFAGVLLDRFGRKRLLIAATLIYGTVGAAGYVLEDLTLLLASRAILGLTVAITMTGASVLIGDYYTGVERSRLTGIQAAIMNFSGASALLLSGVLAETSWHLPFLIYLVGLIVAMSVIVTIHEPDRQLRTPPVSKPETSVTERAVEQTLPIATLFVIYGIMALAMLLFFFVPLQLPFRLAALAGASSSQSGLAVAAALTCTGLVALLNPTLSRLVGRWGRIAAAYFGLGAGLIIIGTGSSFPAIVFGSFLTGIGQGFILPSLTLWIIEISPASRRARALSGLTASIFLGQFISPFVSQPLSVALGLPIMYVGAGIAALGLAVIAVLVAMSAVRNAAKRDGASVLTDAVLSSSSLKG